MGDKPDNQDDESDLFRQSMKGVRPMVDDRHQPKPGSRPKPVPRQTLKDEQQVLDDMFSDAWKAEDVETGEELLFTRSGIQQKVIRQLRRGHFRIDSELDMHGLTVEAARLALTDFLRNSLATGARCVRIVHGKGHGSRNKLPVLKNKVNSWLQQREEVLAFCSARPEDGGTGAMYVLLKRL